MVNRKGVSSYTKSSNYCGNGVVCVDVYKVNYGD